jgi:thiamine-phosphate pyrophosphorylase
MLRAAGRGAIVIVNDRADVARLAGATGVHVGKDDLTPADVRRVAGERTVVGLSTHTAAQLDVAVGQPIDYLAIGPVFGTRTKETEYDAVGLVMVRAAQTAAAPHALPVVAIGGVTLERAPEAIDAGAAAVAVITDLLTGGDPARRVREYIDRLSRV